MRTRTVTVVCLLCISTSGCFKSRGAGTSEGKQRVTKSVKTASSIDVDRGEPTKTPPLPSFLRMNKDGSWEVELPPNTKLNYKQTDEESTDRQMEYTEVMESLFSMPFWVYAIGMIMVIGGLAAAWFTRAIGLALLGVCAGVAWIAGYAMVHVVANKYPYIFVLAALLLFGGLIYMVWHIVMRRKTERENKELAGSHRRLVTAIEQTSPEARKEVKKKVDMHAKSLTSEEYLRHRDMIRRSKRDGTQS